MNAQMDFIGKDGAQGQLAGYMASQRRLDPGNMRPFIGNDGRAYVKIYSGGDPLKKESFKTVPIQTNATLRPNEWKQLDDAVMAISRTRLSGIQDLIDNNLVYSLGNAMGTTVLQWDSMHDAMEAAVTMDGVTRSQGDRITYKTNVLPIPIIHVDYEINARVLAASRSLGNPLDTSSAEAAARKVSEKLEEMLFTNAPYSYGGGTIYGYLNHPDRSTASLGTAWSSDTAANILADVFAMKEASIGKKHYGPWMLYIPVAYEVMLDKDYAAGYPGTIRERIMAIDGIKGIKVVDTLPAGNVLLVQMTSDVVRLVRGMGIQNIEWQTEGKFVNKYKVITISVPQVRSDADGNSGIVHFSV